MSTLLQKKCVPCEDQAPLSETDILKYMGELKGGWEIVPPAKNVRTDTFGGEKIKKRFEFKEFTQAIEFVNKVAKLAEEENHHPDINIRYNKVDILLSTHSIGGLSENDFILASKIDIL